MNVGKTLFVQVVEYVPWKTFARIIERRGGEYSIGQGSAFRSRVICPILSKTRAAGISRR
jgi:hypothetical protein